MSFGRFRNSLIVGRGSRGRPLIDLAGESFGKLRVKRRLPKRNGVTYWRCRCECGRFTSIAATNIKRAKSCGCLNGVKIADETRRYTHLTEAQVAELRHDYKVEKHSIVWLVEKFKVTPKTVYNIVNNITRVPRKPKTDDEEEVEVAQS